MRDSVAEYIVKTGQAGLAAMAIAVCSPEIVRSQQIVPDGTLGAEPSVVGNGVVNGDPVQLIEGGATRGSNLFHSFSDFTIGLGESVYFANPVSIDNILSRVTGNSLSTVDGVLGVAGTANLFLLNPNGIVFGPEAQLDVAGSFTASTAGSFGFSEGGEFSAIAPEQSLLSVSVPLGLQLNAQPQGNLTNSAVLAVGQGETLTLIGNQLSSNVHLSAPGGTVQVLGNQIELIDGTMPAVVSPEDNTEVVFQATDGITLDSALDNEISFLEGTGGIRLAADADADGNGDIVMTNLENTLKTNGRDIAFSGVNIALGSIDTGVTEVNSFSAWPRDGGDVSIEGQGNITTSAIDSSSLSSGDAGNGGDIFISSISGNITTQGILSSTSDAETGDSGNGGAISIYATSGYILTIEDLESFSGARAGDSGSGGTISIRSTSGDILTLGKLQSFAYSFEGDSGAGGDISISSLSGNIDTSTLAAESFSGDGNSGDGGDISISSMSGDILVDIGGTLRSTTISDNRNSGDGGDISISSISGYITTRGALETYSRAFRGNSGNGGDISISSASGNIATEYRLASSSTSGNTGNSGNGGDISIRSTSGNITTQDKLDSSSSTFFGNSGDGGDISISSISGDIEVSRRRRYIVADADFFSFSLSENNSATGGDISVETEEGSIVGDNILLFSSAISQTGRDTGNGGSVTLVADNISDLRVLTLATGGQSGNVLVQNGDESLTASNLRITTSAQVEIPNPRNLFETITLDLTNIGQSGQTFLNSSGDVTLNDVNIQSDANGVNPAGNVAIRSPGTVTFINSQIDSNTNSGGRAGTIRVDAARLNIGNDGRILANTTNAGSGGNIIINATELVSLGEGGQTAEPIISVEASGAGRPGNIFINTPNFLLSETATITATSTENATNRGEGGSVSLSANQMDLAGTVGILAETQGQASGGVLTLQPYQGNLAPDQSQFIEADSSAGDSFNLALARNALISASTTGSGDGGSLQLLAPEAITISGSGRLQVQTEGSGQAGNILADARSLTLSEGVTLSASTTGPGNAGDITFNVSDTLIIDGSTVESRTAPGSTGRGGNINVFNTAQTALLNGGRFTLNSDGLGSGGNVTLTGGTLTLNNGQITAVTRNSDGGNFNISLDDYLLLRNGSLISTEAGTAGAGGDGGSITLNIPNGFVIAVPDENSDIRANAFEGDGGSVNITARNLLGIAFRPGLSDTPASDITASSQFGNSGTVTIDELNPDALQPELDLPVETAPATVARGCRAQAAQAGSFVSTGRGGLPTSPVDLLSDNTIWQDLAPLEAPLAADGTTLYRNLESPNRGTERDPNEPITEARRWRRAADGTVTLLAERAEPTTHLSQADMCGL